MHCRKWRLGLQLCVDVWLFHGCLWLGDNFAGELATRHSKVKKHNWTLVCPPLPIKISDGFKGVVHSAVLLLCSYPRPRLPPPGCLGSSSWCRASASWRPRCPQRSWPAATLTCHAVWRERHTVTPRIQPPPPSLSNNQAHICKYDNINIYTIHFGAWHDTFSSFWKGRGIYSSQCPNYSQS